MIGGQTISKGDVLLVEGNRMFVCVACCRVDNTHGLLVQEGTLRESSGWSYQCSLQPEIQWFALADHEWQSAALSKREHDVITAVSFKMNRALAFCK